MSESAEAALPSPIVRECLELAERRGMIGGDLDAHIEHAVAFAGQWPNPGPPATVVDLGSGGGLPGLVLADMWSEAAVRLAETRQKRADTLEQSVRKARWTPRVQVWSGDVQVATKDHREWADVVSARLFASPALTAECAAPLLRLGGWLIVSEPPDVGSDRRWERPQLERLGFGEPELTTEPFRFIRVQKVAETPAEFPRSRKAMERQPLW